MYVLCLGSYLYTVQSYREKFLPNSYCVLAGTERPRLLDSSTTCLDYEEREPTREVLCANEYTVASSTSSLVLVSTVYDVTSAQYTVSTSYKSTVYIYR